MFNRKPLEISRGFFYKRERVADWYLYMVRCRDGSLYTGITTDVSRRLEEHEGQGNKGAKYLRGRGSLSLVFKMKMEDKASALRLEHRIKKLTKAQKEKLIETNGTLIYADQI